MLGGIGDITTKFFGHILAVGLFWLSLHLLVPKEEARISMVITNVHE